MSDLDYIFWVLIVIMAMHFVIWRVLIVLKYELVKKADEINDDLDEIIAELADIKSGMAEAKQ